MATETGASRLWADFNVKLAADGLREAAAMITQISGEVIPSDVPGSLALGVRQAAGVVLGIAPWNAPVILGVRAIALPLACGNTVVLKGSETCPATHGLIIEALQDAGLPRGVVNFVTNAPANAGDIVEAIIAEPVQGAAFGAFANSGQICMSTERIVVDTKIADEFVARLAEKARSLPLGDPRKGPTVLGSVVDMATVRRCNDLIDDALAKGATLVCGGKSETTLMPATLLDHVTVDMHIYREESFGPVKAIVRVNGDEEAIACANDNEYGLSAAVFSRDVARALTVAKRIESGLCHVNGPTVHDEAQMPFGGMKSSGFGHFGGKAGIAEFTDLRWITVQTTPRHYPF
ncbi:NAD-dependent aldehyde dehydrogenase family protein [Medicago truncatula]|uniref:NAD-dependent aldehyde dehydrogenase family protein n=1 Tax=Medicago truncatula TaxID=3880 RepID=A0A072TCP3_MEDTR|nr:NAD-dependent aldehyde dehydrogenase family protein [Medicago truncatula]